MSPTNAVVYCRISQDRTGAGAGVERQRADCEKLAKELGYNVAHVFIDNDVSAYSSRPRPEYRAMLRTLAEGNAGALLAWHVDRLYRSIPDLSELVAVCDAHDVAIHTVKAGPVDLTTPSGRLSATMFAGIARYEVERSAERLKSAKDQQAREGKFRGGPRPFGYKDGGMELEPKEADAIRAAAEHLLAGGSLMSVTKQWERAGIRTARGGDRFTVSSLRRILVRARNAGLVEQGDRIVGPALWPAIFDVDTMHAVRAVVADPSRRTAVSYERTHQGSGLYRCGKCGGPMKVFKGSGGRDYRCVETPHLSTRKEPLDDYISQIVVARLSAPDAAGLATSTTVDVVALRTRREALQARKDELADLFTSGQIDGLQLSRGSADLQRQIDLVERELASARIESPLSDVVAADDVADYWETATADVRAKIIDALMVVTVQPMGPGNKPRGWTVADRVRVDWKV